MPPSDRTRFLTRGSFLLVAALAASACNKWTPTPIPTPTPTPEVQLTPITNARCVTGAPPSVTRSFLSAKEFSVPYVPAVVLVAARGPDAGTHIDEVISLVPMIESNQFDEITLFDLVIRLYALSSGPADAQAVWQVVDLILEAALKLGHDVIGTPDWMLGTPWPVEGSPWPVEGGPWPVEGSPGPYGDQPWEDGGIQTGIDASQFWTQWAWTQMAAPTQAYERSGAGSTRVAVLDTSPFEEPGEYEMNFVGEGDFSLCVSYPEDMQSLVAYDWASNGSLEQHGFAVAGTIAALAPASQIQLVRVLDANATGDLVALLKGIAAAILERGSADEGLVINMSLGFPRGVVSFPDDQEEPCTATGAGATSECKLKALAAGLDPDCGNPGDAAFDETLTLLAPLCLVMEAAGEGGIAFVAAAGNDYRKSVSLPADWPKVVGVGAANEQGNLSCYSNVGEGLAPGGQGWELTANDGCPKTPPRCDLADIESCRYGVVTLALQNHSHGGFRQAVGYSFWTGSSFATPDVSAMAACLLENGYPAADAMAEILGLFAGTVIDFGRLPVRCFPESAMTP